MNRTWKKYRVLLAAGGMSVCMAAGLGMGIHWSRSYAKKTVVEAAEKEFLQEAKNTEIGGAGYGIPNGQDENRLYKDVVIDVDIAKEVCERYDLDYDTVLEKDVTRQMRNYEEALWLKKEMGDRPLLSKEQCGEDISKGYSSLEVYLCDIYAFGDGAEVIKSMCGEFGIDPEQAVISDLATEQLIQIGEKAYETSDHPKE